MKTIVSLFAFSVFAQFGFSQPVISNVIPGFGDQMLYTQKEGSPDPGLSGPNIMWDFSDLTFDGFSAIYTVSDPGDIEGSDQFPDASMVWTVDFGFAPLNSYMSTENNEFATYGSVDASSGSVSGTILTDPDVLYSYPFSYLDSGSDSYSGTVHAVGFESLMSGTSTRIVDGYGTVITPYGTYENVLRTTTSKVQVLETGAIQFVANITETNWFSADYPVPVLLMSSTIDTYMGVPIDSSFAVTALVSYTQSTRIDKAESNVMFDIYPNPTADYLTLRSDFQGVAELSIFSIDGKIVARKSVQNENRINLMNLQSGYYIARLKVDNQPAAQRAFIIK